MAAPKQGFMAMLARALRPNPVKGRNLIGTDKQGNQYFEKPDPNGGRYARRTVELSDPTAPMTNYDDANIAVQWQSWLRNTRQTPPTQEEIARDEVRKKLTQARAKVLDQAWQDRKAELSLEQDLQFQKLIMDKASATTATTTTSTSTTVSSTSERSTLSTSSPSPSSPSSPSSPLEGASAAAQDNDEINNDKESTKDQEDIMKVIKKQIEERDRAKKFGFKSSVQQGDSFEPKPWSPVAAPRKR